ncbi:DsbA family protein [Saccharothrix sp. S26]|uniref:2-hydroxychromene-2-carboxylate isomerase n=1 Tax=Saccharothrix sp. S26 TaxID=2907215 RepID=UPI001F2AB542|nr:DsbA family protein [Saccharothrix sp. S26]MCE6995127.1 DsbA family protein [Saccharothrix sp. S26]
MRVKKPPRLYFSFRSPFSWLALRRLEERLPQAREIIEFVPYWDPDPITAAGLEERDAGFHYTQMSKAKHLYILQDTKRLVAEHGHRMAWPIDVDPWWELPHLAWIKARHLGQDRVFYDAVTRARWERGEDICEVDVLSAALEQAGLDPEPLVSAVDDPAIREEGLDALVQAWHDDIFGIPYFKVGRHRFWGLDRLDAYLDVLLPTLQELPVPAATTLDDVPVPVLERVGGADHDTAGGCG